MTGQQGVLRLLINKIHVRSFLAINSLILTTTGCALIYSGVQGNGVIDLNASFFHGHLQSGEVGLFVVLMGIAVAFMVLRSYSVAGRTVEINLSDNTTFKITGVTHLPELVQHLEILRRNQAV